MSKFKDQLSKDDLKKFAKEVGKKLTASDFKHGKITDLREIPEKKVRAIKDYVTDYFKRAVDKKKAIESERANRKSMASNGVSKSSEKSKKVESKSLVSTSEAMDMEMSDDDGVTGQIISMSGTPVTPAIGTPYEEGLGKRKRSNDEIDEFTPADTPLKRFKEYPMDERSPPPPPPPPPSAPMTLEEEAIAAIAAQEEEFAAQEEESMLESEDAIMRDEEVMNEYNGISAFHGNHSNDRNEYNGLPAFHGDHSNDRNHSSNGFNSNSGFNSHANSRPNSRQSMHRDFHRDSRHNSVQNSRPVSPHRNSRHNSVQYSCPVNPHRNSRHNSVQFSRPSSPHRHSRHNSVQNSRPVSRNGNGRPFSRNGIRGGGNHVTPDSDSPRASQSPQILDADLEGLHPDRRRQLLGL